MPAITKVIGIAERTLTANPATPVTLVAATATDVIPDQTVEPRKLEIVNRYIQNVGADPVYYAFGQNAGPNNYHGILPQYAQADASSHRLRVSCYSTAGSTVAVTIIYRNETVNNTIVNPSI